MGMSASQARLLSITSRLSDNELRSQTITTAKTSLANKTTMASAAYMAALSQTELRYSTYDGSGNKMTQVLTGHNLTHYGQLKNQYGIINNSGQILVSEYDAMNFESSEDMYDFLDKYGVLAPEGTGEMVQVVNPDWQVAWGEYQDQLADWKAQEPNKYDEKYWTEVVNTDDKLYKLFLDASKGCYTAATGSSSGCYVHVLAHLLLADFDPNEDLTGSKTYTTTTGDTQSIDCGYAYIQGSTINGQGKTPDMRIVSEEVINKPIMCAENETMKQELLDVVNNTALSEDEKKAKKLMNNYYLDANGEPQLKTLAQKCVDLIYLLQNYTALGLDYANDCKPLLITFQQDMEQAFTKMEFDKEAYEKDVEDWKAQEPPKPTVDYYIDQEIRTILRKDEAQWYINLWHRMNGASDVKGGTVDENGNIIDTDKTEDGLPMYKVLEDGLMNSPEWLQNSLNNGTVTLERVEFVSEAEVGTGLSDCKWNSIIWTNAIDITEEQNEAAITKAEIEYKQALSDIEAKDKQYDNQLKRLDTEHSALQTEYDSIKELISKNVERTLKMYS
ncbi:hypothetical protein IKU74_08110 [bacterium]|nr:hypothetical protein [bacterium]